jgi:lipopolysaccharide export system ATP-binding protein
MGYLSQETSVFRKLSVEQNIVAILEAMPGSRSLGRRLTRRERWDTTDKVLTDFGLTHVRKNNAARLSGGEKRRLEIARCLVCEPLLILLDEPFTGIDPKTIADIQQIVRKLRDQGIGILLTDHNVRETLKITDRSYLIKDGHVRTHGTPQQIIHDRIAIDEYLGETFNDTGLGGFPGAPRIEAGTPVDVHSVLEQERVHRLIQALRTDDPIIVRELEHCGPAAVPGLLEALELRDVELRRRAFAVLHQILHGDATFDPYAPEALRRQQIADIRQNLERKAG